MNSQDIGTLFHKTVLPVLRVLHPLPSQMLSSCLRHLNALALQFIPLRQPNTVVFVLYSPHTQIPTFLCSHDRPPFRKNPCRKKAMERILEADRLTYTARNMQDVSYMILAAEAYRLGVSYLNS